MNVTPRSPYFGGLVAVAALLCGPVLASPPACLRTDIDHFSAADVVVTAEVTQSRRWREGTTTLHLVATYRIVESFKGSFAAGQSLIVTHTCLDAEVPRSEQGYPRVVDYCPGGSGSSLTGVDSAAGAPIEPQDDSGWVLLLREDRRRGAPEVTWLEIGDTSFGLDCGRTRESLSEEGREALDRLAPRLSRW